MENEYSTSGMLEDLIRSMVQLVSVELHAKTACEKAEQALAEAEEDETSCLVNELVEAESYLERVTNLRRTSMRLIASKSDKVKPTKWCEVKHSAMAMYTAFEAFQADSKNASLAQYYYDCNRLFIEVVSDWLGLDIPPCASCFEDALKGVKHHDD